MEKLIIPPNPNWFVPSTCYSAPDNGLIYGAASKIAFVTSKEKETKDPAIKILDIRKKINCFAVSPLWSDNHHVAVMTSDDLVVMIYDFMSGKALKGHKGHKAVGVYRQDQYSSIIYTSATSIISSFHSEVIQYCLRTNQYNVFPEFTNRNPITLMKLSPFNSSLVAAGTKNGLIILFDSEKMNIMARFRGHDAEVTCLDFMVFPLEKSVKKEKTAPANDDMFDIYSYDNVDTEFGVYKETAEDRSDDEETNQAEMQEKMHNTSNFDFLEACSTLKETILSNNYDIPDNTKNTGKFEDNREQYGLENVKDPSPDLSIESNPSSHTPVLTEESLNYFEEQQRMNDFVVVPKENDLVILASGSRETVVWLWNVTEQKPLHKIKWHPKVKKSLPSIFTNVLWLNDSLLITDNNGDIIEYKIRVDGKSKGVKDEKTKKTFNARGIISLCKTPDNSSLWLSSIHRNITCLNVTTNTATVSLDTLQIRVHCLIENPIDSHIIAIGGNDKRLCLWNTSEANHHTITLKAFLNKIQTSILALSWHPEKDNLIAFSTREGRVAVLDTTRFTNVPIILKPFSTHEVYSLAWAKLMDVIILLACSNGKLVYYSQKDYELHHLNQFAQINSISTSEKRMVLGTSMGDLLICDLTDNFKVLTRRKLSKKYIGMMCWHGQNQVAVASDSGVTLVKDVDKFIAIPSTTPSSEELSSEIVTTLSNRKGRVYSARFNKAGTHLVSCCMHGNIDVYNVSEGKLVATMNIETPAYSAIFMPHNESIIVCGGQDSTVCAFEWANYPPSSEGTSAVTETHKHEALEKFKNVEWATILELTTIGKHSNRRVKKKVKENTENGNLEEVTKAINAKLNLNTAKKSHSIFIAANRELFSNSLDILEMLLKDGEREISLNELMMGDRNDIQKIIDKELEEMPEKSIGSVILPQLTDDLKKDIMERIASKSLMDIHVAIAPAVSYDLWRKCCLAYGEQLIENEQTIEAMPYLLAINDVDKCIDKLCETRHYREAWIVAKLRKEKDDPQFERIMQEWIRYYELNGNYEPAAALLCMKKEYKRAHEMLSKRQNKLPKCAEICELLSTKLGAEATRPAETQ